MHAARADRQAADWSPTFAYDAYVLAVNGVAERWVETARRDLLDHVIALNERHLQRLLSEFVAYQHDDRTHLRLGGLWT